MFHKSLIGAVYHLPSRSAQVLTLRQAYGFDKPHRRTLVEAASAVADLGFIIILIADTPSANILI